MSGSGREAHSDVQECSGGPQMSESGWEALPDIWEWSGVPLGCPGVVGIPSRMSGSGREIFPYIREALPNIREW